MAIRQVQRLGTDLVSVNLRNILKGQYVRYFFALLLVEFDEVVAPKL